MNLQMNPYLEEAVRYEHGERWIKAMTRIMIACFNTEAKDNECCALLAEYVAAELIALLKVGDRANTPGVFRALDFIIHEYGEPAIFDYRGRDAEGEKIHVLLNDQNWDDKIVKLVYGRLDVKESLAIYATKLNECRDPVIKRQRRHQ